MSINTTKNQEAELNIDNGKAAIRSLFTLKDRALNPKFLELLLFVCSGQITSVDEFKRRSDKAYKEMQEEAERRYEAYQDDLLSQFYLSNFLSRCLLDKSTPFNSAFIKGVLENMGKERSWPL